MSSIFKAYDIRGIYGKDLTDAVAYDVGRAYVSFTRAKTVVVGRDCRSHSLPLQTALMRGLTDQGADVIDIGLCSTPMNYYANGALKADGSIMITASHNPAAWNGFKMCTAQAVPLFSETGIYDIGRMVTERTFDALPDAPGSVREHDILPAYRDHVRRHIAYNRRPKLLMDYANGMGIVEAKTFLDTVDAEGLFDTLDGTFPNHEANPLRTATLADLQRTIPGKGFDFGIAFDGDADRVGFVDELGNIVSMDLVAALIAQDVLAREKGVICYDLRASRILPEVIEANGGHAEMSRVGHAFVKQRMRQFDALFAGELSGHYYFRDNFTAESSSMAVIALCNILTASGKTLSELIAPLRKYHHSGEINSKVDCTTQEVLDDIRHTYADANLSDLDGITVTYPTWRFNVRCSNTEPLVRLNLESFISKDDRDRRITEVLALIRKPRH